MDFNKVMVVLLSYVLAGVDLVAGIDDCPRNQDAINLENRECRTYCAEKPCRSPYAICLCDGDCGKSCINKGHKCPQPKTIHHGKFEFTPYNRGQNRGFLSNLSYTCDEGYEIVGNKERTCRGDELWSGNEPFCTLKGVHCETPSYSVENGYPDIINQKKFYINETVLYKCETGFSPSQDSNAKTQCQLDPDDHTQSIWRPAVTLTCKVKHCRAPVSIDNGRYVPERVEYSFGMHTEYICNPGYTLEGQVFTTCLEDRTWSAKTPPYCRAIECIDDVDEILNGKVVKSGTIYQSFLTYECNEGYLLQGEKNRWCSEDGEWNGRAPVCKEIDCGNPPPPRKGYINYQSGTKWKNRVEYKCNANATTLQHFMNAECGVNNGKAVWSIQPPECHENCKNIQNINMFYIPSKHSYKHNEQVNVKCSHGAEVHPVASQEKLVSFETLCNDGAWKNTFTCQPARCLCKDLPVVWLQSRKFEAQNCNEIHEHGEELQLQCLSEYQYMRQSGTLRCHRGRWVYPSDQLVGCEKRQCDLSSSNLNVRNGKIEATFKGTKIFLTQNKVVNHHTQFKITCEENYELFIGEELGKNSILFCNDGKIEGRLPTCKPARCSCDKLKQQLNPENIEVRSMCKLTNHETSIGLSCKDGFSSTTELPSATCSFGIWSHINVFCHKKCSCSTFSSDVQNPTVLIFEQCEEEFYHEQKAMLNCRTGYSGLTGSHEAFCSDGKWIINHAKCYADCMHKKDDFENGYLVAHKNQHVRPGSNVSHEEVVQLKCKEGFYSDPERSSLTCYDGKWSQHRKCSKIPEKETISAEDIISTTATVQEHIAEVNAQTTYLFTSIQTPPSVTFESTENFASACDPLLNADPNDQNCSGDDEEEDENGGSIAHSHESSIETGCFLENMRNLLANGDEIGIRRNFSHNAEVTFRCASIVTFKLVGKFKIKCKNGKWNNLLPKCLKLNERQDGNPPMIKYIVADEEDNIDDDGSLVVSEGTNLILQCSWFKQYGEPVWSGFQPSKDIGPPVWNQYKNEYNLPIINIQRDFPKKYTCSILGKENTFRLKVLPALLTTTASSTHFAPQESGPISSDHQGVCTKKNNDHTATYKYEVFGPETKLSVAHGTRMDISCHDGYEVLPTETWDIKKEGISGCNNGRWMPDVFCSPARCLCSTVPSDLLKKNFMYVESFEGAHHATYVDVKCNNAYQQQDLKLTCRFGQWDTTEIENKHCVPEKNSCQLRHGYFINNNVVVFLDGMMYSRNSGTTYFKNGATLAVRCEKPLEFKLWPSGKHKINCLDGSWTSHLPECRLVGYGNFPVRIRVYNHQKNSLQLFTLTFTNDGILILPKWKYLMVICTKNEIFKPVLTLEEFTYPRKLAMIIANLKDGMYANFNTAVQERVEGKIGCFYKNEGHEQPFVIGDICQPPSEDYISRLYRAQIIPENRKTVYVQEDQIPLQCKSNQRKIFLLCLEGGNWGISEVC